MREGYGSRSVYLSVCYCASCYIPGSYNCMSKVMRYRVSCRLLKISIVWTSLGMFCSGDMPVTMIGDSALSPPKTPMVLDTITNGIVYELLARSDDYLK